MPIEADPLLSVEAIDGVILKWRAVVMGAAPTAAVLTID
jgi:hypothetical protein